MAGYKVDRASQDILVALTEILREVKDPRITGMLSVVRVELTNDYSYCTVFISAMEGLETAQASVKGLTAAKGYIRRELSHRVHMRHTPELRFVADGSIEHSAEISRILNDLNR